MLHGVNSLLSFLPGFELILMPRVHGCAQGMLRQGLLPLGWYVSLQQKVGHPEALICTGCQ